ncbi:MAG: hypothetical protein KAH56_09700 [Candidatus Krumholzibacteria bacterium]|nr:hypothetical protein [Candidatus Krumholzibacteria bacterium]
MASADNENRSGFNAPAVVLSGIAAVIFIWALVLFLQGGFLAAQAREYNAKVYNSVGNEDVQAALAEQRAILNEKTRWLDEEKGTVCMPIEDAEARFVNKVEESQ